MLSLYLGRVARGLTIPKRNSPDLPFTKLAHNKRRSPRDSDLVVTTDHEEEYEDEDDEEGEYEVSNPNVVDLSVSHVAKHLGHITCSFLYFQPLSLYDPVAPKKAATKRRKLSQGSQGSDGSQLSSEGSPDKSLSPKRSPRLKTKLGGSNMAAEVLDEFLGDEDVPVPSSEEDNVSALTTK